MDKGKGDFLTTFESVLTAAMEWGVRNVPPRTGAPPKWFTNNADWKKFMAACHRGYEKAQNRILELLIDLHNDKLLPTEERTYRELAYRRIIDAIAFTMLRTESHVVRRFVIHDYPPHFDLDVVLEAKTSVDKLNSESRLTFALLADLTTFVHVADILRVDLRSRRPGVSFIELKTGRINSMLLSKLEDYEPRLESLDLLRADPSIEKRYLPQAERMLKQMIRFEQIKELILGDVGIDIGQKLPTELVGPTIETESYDQILDELCDEARKYGSAASSVQSCIHIGVGFSEDDKEAKASARDAARFALYKQIKNPPAGLADVRSELLDIIPKQELYKGWELFTHNLVALSSKPFPLWEIKRDHKISLLDRKMSIFSVFDLPSFIWLGRSIGLDIGLSDRKKAAHFYKEIGSKDLPMWDRRAIRYAISKGEVIMGGGMLGRFINDLNTPLQFLKIWRDE